MKTTKFMCLRCGHGVAQHEWEEWGVSSCLVEGCGCQGYKEGIEGRKTPRLDAVFKPDIGGNSTETRLAAEVAHADWCGKMDWAQVEDSSITYGDLRAIHQALLELAVLKSEAR